MRVGGRRGGAPLARRRSRRGGLVRVVRGGRLAERAARPARERDGAARRAGRERGRRRARDRRARGRGGSRRGRGGAVSVSADRACRALDARGAGVARRGRRGAPRVVRRRVLDRRVDGRLPRLLAVRALRAEREDRRGSMPARERVRGRLRRRRRRRGPSCGPATPGSRTPRVGKIARRRRPPPPRRLCPVPRRWRSSRRTTPRGTCGRRSRTGRRCRSSISTSGT